MYICKNLFYFQIEQYSTFGEKGSYLNFVPPNCSIKSTMIANLKYRIENLSSKYEDIRRKAEERLITIYESEEPEKTDIHIMKKTPF